METVKNGNVTSKKQNLVSFIFFLAAMYGNFFSSFNELPSCSAKFLFCFFSWQR